jgi:pyridoxamine 5'-phosphate oxidase
VRITGEVHKLSAAQSDAYFAGRPRGSQISAWASPQSQMIPDRSSLEERMAATEQRFSGVDVPRPPHWGGYRVNPARFEFWQGRPNRAHDRIVFTVSGPHDEIKRFRLAP